MKAILLGGSRHLEEHEVTDGFTDLRFPVMTDVRLVDIADVVPSKDFQQVDRYRLYKVDVIGGEEYCFYHLMK